MDEDRFGQRRSSLLWRAAAAADPLLTIQKTRPAVGLLAHDLPDEPFERVDPAVGLDDRPLAVASRDQTRTMLGPENGQRRAAG
jgi:hypothetical protein